MGLSETSARQIVAMQVCYFTPGKQGGYETRVIEEISLLAAQGVVVVMACFMPSNLTLPQDAMSEFGQRLQDSTGAKVYLLPTAHYFDFEENNDICASIVNLARLYNVDIIHGQALYSTMHILRARHHLNAKIVFDVHGISPEETAISGGHSKRIEYLTTWERQALNTADLSLFVSNRMKEHFKTKYRWSESPNCVVPCCVNTKDFLITEARRISKRIELGFHGKFVLLYLGTLSAWQWPEAIFALFAQFHKERPDSLLYLLLPNSDHGKARSFLEEHELSTESYRLEEVPHNQIGSIAGVADVGLLLREENAVNYVSSPTKFGEYLAAGLPVIATAN